MTWACGASAQGRDARAAGAGADRDARRWPGDRSRETPQRACARNSPVTAAAGSWLGVLRAAAALLRGWGRAVRPARARRGPPARRPGDAAGAAGPPPVPGRALG